MTVHAPVPRTHLHFLGRYLALERGKATLLSVLILGSIALQLAAPWIFGQFVDAARAGGNVRTLTGFGVKFIVITVLLQGLNVLTGVISSRVGWRTTNRLRLDLTEHCLGLDQEFHKRHTSGELIERIDGDAGLLAAFFSRLTVDLLGNALLLLGVVLVLLRLDWRVGLSGAVFAALALWSLTVIRARSRSAWSGVRDVTTRTFGLVGEALSGIEDLRANGGVPYLMNRFFALLREWRPLQIRSMMTFAAAWSAPLLIFACGDAMAFLLAARLHAQGSLSLGGASTVFFYVALMARPIDQIRVQLQNLQRVDASLTRVGALLEERSALEDHGRQSVPAGPPAVSFERVTYRYDAEGPAAINGLTLELRAGRTVGVLGRTGSGKTTLTRLLFRFCDPQSGEVRLGGVPLRELSLTTLRSSVGLVTQDVQLLSASVRDNLTFYDPSVAEEHLWTALSNVGLSEWCRALPGQLDEPLRPSALSAGEAQLLALARLSLQDPQLVILDEASSRLDRATEARLDRALRQLLAGRTALVIAHRLATVSQVDDILVLSGGQVAEFGARTVLERDPDSHYSALRRAGLEGVLT
ncbi:ABC transporter ATP-binding protein [Deinococcus altitudinis]|uniref:ABC transporter ATP-binding protein n=1 Tax=Deinococcus altitudinis TaxID=468914 RepID=UPI003891E1B2